MPTSSRPLAGAFLLVIAALTFASAPAGAQAMTGGTYRLEPWSIDGGGGASSAGGYDLGGTIGQPDAHSSAAGDYALDGGFWWRLGDATTAVPKQAPLRFAFHAPAPNPSHGSCKFAFDLPREARVRADVFGVDGRRVAAVLDRVMGAGRASVPWNGRADDGHALAAGVYLVRLSADSDQAVRRVVLLDR